MPYGVVCISRAVGAGGEAVGRAVSEQLGFRYVDDEVIALASERAGIDPAVVVKAEQHTSFVSRLMDALTPGPMEVKRLLPLGDRHEYYSAQVRPSVTRPQEELRRFIQAAIVEIADRGNAVIVAHAASIALGARKDALRVLVTASARTRSNRLWLNGGLLNEERAAQAIVESDRERARYLERFFDLRDERPTHYDLVINTDVLRIEQAVGAIVAAANA